MLEYFPEDHRFYVEHELKLRLHRRPQYSLRAFARDLSLSPSTLSEFLNGYLGLSRTKTIHVAQKINLTTEQSEHFWNLMESRFSRSLHKRREAAVRAKSRIHSEQTKVSLDEFQFIADWYHLAILELLELAPIYQDIKILSKALGLTRKKTTEGVERLLKLNLIKKENGQLIIDKNTTNVGENVPSESVRLFHSQILAKALNAIETQSLEQRDFSSTMISINNSDIPEIKKELNQFWLSLASKYSAKSKKNSLYCLSTQFFDLLKINPLTTHQTSKEKA